MRIALGIATLVAMAVACGWFGYMAGITRGADIGRAEVAIYQMRLHPRTRVNIPSGVYDFKYVAPDIPNNELLFKPYAVMWVPGLTSSARTPEYQRE